VASEISGIGWGKSKAVEDFFPSVMDMVMASEKDWRKIPGIGKEIAKIAVEEIRKEMNSVKSKQ
jgi:excinuclease UvrABC nuclease subunit